jgi:hypothetical protein
MFRNETLILEGQLHGDFNMIKLLRTFLQNRKM